MAPFASHQFPKIVIPLQKVFAYIDSTTIIQNMHECSWMSIKNKSLLRRISYVAIFSQPSQSGVWNILQSFSKCLNLIPLAFIKILSPSSCSSWFGSTGILFYYFTSSCLDEMNWIILLYGDRRKAFRLISNRNHCQRSSPSRISDTPRAGFEPAQNMSSGLVKWSCTVVRTTTPSSGLFN